MDAEARTQRPGRGPPLVLDGPVGTGLERRGVETAGALWSTGAVLRRPDAVRAVHAAHRAAGADVVTTATFRLGPRSLGRAGLGAEEGGRLAAEAVRLAREGAPGAWVAGSMGPAEDCYRPDLAPSDEDLRREHAARAAWLAAAGADLLLAETMGTVRESTAAVRAAHETGLNVWASVVCAPGGRLLSGEAVEEWVEAVAPMDPAVLLVNCTGIPATMHAVEALRDAWDGAWGAYPNRSDGDPMEGFAGGRDATVEELRVAAGQWRLAGARVLGTCCGFTPGATRALSALVRKG